MIAAALLLALSGGLDTPAYTACMARADGVTLPMRECIEAEHVRWDARLNGAYQRRTAERAPAAVRKLRGEERGWLQRREVACRRAGQAYAGGSLQPVQIELCILRWTQQRALQLEHRGAR